MLLILLLPALALAAGWASYRWLEPAAASRTAMAARGLGVAGLALLLLDPSCAARGGGEPLVLLDTSPSTGAPGGPGAALADSARRLGEVVPFGGGGVTHLAPALRSAAESIPTSDGRLRSHASRAGKYGAAPCAPPVCAAPVCGAPVCADATPVTATSATSASGGPTRLVTMSSPSASSCPPSPSNISACSTSASPVSASRRDS